MAREEKEQEVQQKKAKEDSIKEREAAAEARAIRAAETTVNERGAEAAEKLALEAEEALEEQRDEYEAMDDGPRRDSALEALIEEGARLRKLKNHAKHARAVVEGEKAVIEAEAALDDLPHRVESLTEGRVKNASLKAATKALEDEKQSWRRQRRMRSTHMRKQDLNWQ